MKAEEEHGVKGEIGTREEVSTPTTPVALVQSGGSQSAGTLPLTGFNALFQVIMGGLSLMGGSLLFWRLRTV